MSVAIHDHLHAPNRFAVIPTGVRLNADPQYTGKGVTIAFLDSGFYPHPDLSEISNRVLFYKDITEERVALDTSDPAESWQWHGTQTLNTVGCSPPRVQNGDLVFVYHDDEARSVSLAGDFNAWNAGSNQLTKDATGLWLCKLATPGPGRYEYKFVVDNTRWTEDPRNGMKVSDGYGGLNSVVVIQG